MFTFPKTARLLKASQYLEVLRGSELNLSSGPLRIRARRNRMPVARLGLVVTKKGTSRANKRNRIKRLIRESFRHEAPQLPAVDVVIQVFGDIDEAKLRDQLQQMFNQIRQELS